MENYKCKLHGDEFVTKWSNGENACLKCNRQQLYEFRRRCKRELVDLFGGECEICGYNKCIRSLQSHHLDPSEKLFTISAWTKFSSFEKVLQESKKCILLCANCHGEVESKITEISKSILDRNLVNKILEDRCVEFLNDKLKTFYDKKCKCCEKKFQTSNKKQKFCSLKCNALLQRKVARPTKEELATMVWEMPTSKISQNYGVSDKAIEKWVKNYGLTKPTRGYWTKVKYKRI